MKAYQKMAGKSRGKRREENTEGLVLASQTQKSEYELEQEERAHRVQARPSYLKI
jgi:hypothetical protein